MARRWPPGRLRLLALAGAALAAGVARADGVTAHLEPGVVTQDLETRTPVGTTHQSSVGLSQDYELLLDREFLPNIRLSAGGSYKKLTVDVTTDGSTAQRTDSLDQDLFARLNVGSPILRASAGVERLGREISGMPLLTTDRATFSAGWRPVELPELTLELSRTHDYEPDRTQADATTTSALAAIRYDVNRVDLLYRIDWTDRSDVPTATHSSSVDQNVQGSYTEQFLDERIRLYLAGTFTNRQVTATTDSASGLVEQQQFPIAGLSLVEAFPATPDLDTLLPNPALIDGNLTVSAAVNLGYRPPLSSDTALRDLGVQMADVVTTVNTFYVWVDQPLPATVWQAYAFTAWQSDDNQHWTQVCGVTSGSQVVPLCTVTFGATRNRFEIGIPATRARYLKVVTAPLAPGITTDLRYLDVFVTEVQVLDVVPASSIPAHQATTISTASGTLTAAILRGEHRLAYDFSTELSYLSTNSLSTWLIVNGLTYGQRLGILELNARVARRDRDTGSGYEAVDEWSASLSARPLSTLYSALSYGGFFDEKDHTTSSSLSFHTRAELYEGVSAQVAAGGSVGTQTNERASASGNASAVLSLVPNRYATVSMGWQYGIDRLYQYGVLDSSATTQRVDASATLRPFPALSGTFEVQRIIQGARPTTLATAQITGTPLRGELQLGLAYTKTLDTAAQSTNQLGSATARWNIRRNVYINANYSLLDITAPVQSTRSRVFSASLAIYL